MNKQEAIEKIKDSHTLTIDDKITDNLIDMVIKSNVLAIVEQIDEPKKAIVPQFVAEWIERCKNKNGILFSAMTPNEMPKAVNEWLFYDKNDDIFARAWLDGYEVEQEKRYKVIMKNIQDKFNILNHNNISGNYFFSRDLDPCSDFETSYTKSELEQAGFGEVFESSMFEVEEVTE